jgi:hypothetical protein
MLNRFDGKQTLRIGWCALAVFLTATTSRSQPSNGPTPPESRTQTGDEIIVCGERFHTGAPVVLWTDKGGYQGILGHYHVQTDKQDPGPAFQWDTVIMGARKLMTPQALAANATARGKPARFIPSVPTQKNGK